MDNPVAIFLMGDAPECIRAECGNFDAMFIRAAGLEEIPHTVVRIAEGEKPEPPSAYSATILTGSLAMVTDEAPWSVRTEQWLRQAVMEDACVFAVCYGHQLLCKALGGRVDYHPNGPETGTLDMFMTALAATDPLTEGMPEVIRGNLAHSQTVTTLPRGAQVIALSKHDPHQVVRYARNIWSVQFHPEFDRKAMAAWNAYTKANSPDLPIAEPAEDTPQAREILRRFVRLYTGGDQS